MVGRFRADRWSKPLTRWWSRLLVQELAQVKIAWRVSDWVWDWWGSRREVVLD